MYRFVESVYADCTDRFLYPLYEDAMFVHRFDEGDVISIIDYGVSWVRVQEKGFYVMRAWIEACVKDGVLEKI